MPRYYFDVRDGRDIDDDVGQELPDLAAVKRQALRYAGCLIAELDQHFWADNDWQIDVSDERRLRLFSLMFISVPAPALATALDGRRTSARADPSDGGRR